jgi:hypothetical protein
LIDESAMWKSRSARPERIASISGWSQTAVAMSPTRPVCSRPAFAVARIDDAGYCLMGAIA